EALNTVTSAMNMHASFCGQPVRAMESQCRMDHQGSRRHAPAPPNVDAEACGSVEELWQTSGALLGRLPPVRRVGANRRVEGHEFPLPAALGTINRHRGVNEWTKGGA